MQENSYAIPHWVFTLLQVLGGMGLGGLIYRFIVLWQNRKRPSVEVEKLAAETTEITIRSRSAAGDAVTRMMDRLELAQIKNDDLRAENEDLENENGKLKSEIEGYERQMKRMSAIMELAGVKWSDYDRPKP